MHFGNIIANTGDQIEITCQLSPERGKLQLIQLNSTSHPRVDTKRFSLHYDSNLCTAYQAS